MIIDAGGGTVDLSTYSFTAVRPISVEEIALPGCLLLCPETSSFVLMQILTLVRHPARLHKS
jgi:hypothetical protein